MINNCRFNKIIFKINILIIFIFSIYYSLKKMLEKKSKKLLKENRIENEEKDDKFYKEKRKEYIIKGLISLFSCIVHTLGYFSVWTLGNYVVYLISFRRNYNQNLTFSYGYFLFPIMNFSLSLSSPIGGVLEDKIGGKKAIFLSTMIIYTSFSIMYFSRNIFFDYALMILNGIGMAIGINIPRKNVCSFFMNNQALVCGIISLVPGLLSAFINIFNEKYILNPLSESPTIENLYYEEKIYLNFQKLLLFEIAFLIVICFITLATYIQNNPKETIKYGFGENVNESQDSKKTKKKNKKNEVSKELKIKKAIYNIRAVKLFLMIFLFFPTINFVNNTWRPIGIYYKINTYYLQLIGAFYSIIGCISSVIFALVGDKIQFRILFVVFAVLLTFSSFTFPMSFKNDIFFVCEIMIISFVLNGFNIIIDPHMMKVYGMENYIEIGGAIRSSAGICEIASVIFAFYLENNYSGSKNYVYNFIYMISGCTNLISLFLGIFENDEKFDYYNK